MMSVVIRLPSADSETISLPHNGSEQVVLAGHALAVAKQMGAEGLRLRHGSFAVSAPSRQWRCDGRDVGQACSAPPEAATAT